MDNTATGQPPRPRILGNRPLKPPAPVTAPPPAVTDPFRPAPAQKPEPKRRKAVPPPSVEGALLTAGEVAALLRVSVKALEHRRRRGIAPKHVCLGGAGRSVRYRREDVDAYLAELAQRGGHIG